MHVLEPTYTVLFSAFSLFIVHTIPLKNRRPRHRHCHSESSYRWYYTMESENAKLHIIHESNKKCVGNLSSMHAYKQIKLSIGRRKNDSANKYQQQQ